MFLHVQIAILWSQQHSNLAICPLSHYKISFACIHFVCKIQHEDDLSLNQMTSEIWGVIFKRTVRNFLITPFIIYSYLPSLLRYARPNIYTIRHLGSYIVKINSYFDDVKTRVSCLKLLLEWTCLKTNMFKIFWNCLEENVFRVLRF